MARAGVFDDLDAAITWHPGWTNTRLRGQLPGVDNIKFRFHGRTAHAAAQPEPGRSALDAVELMNVGVNFLREHVIDAARIHYVITNGGGAPNVVPDEAEVWYFIRAPRRDQVEELTARVRKIAQGAALMTETTMEERSSAASYNICRTSRSPTRDRGDEGNRPDSSSRTRNSPTRSDVAAPSPRRLRAAHPGAVRVARVAAVGVADRRASSRRGRGQGHARLHRRGGRELDHADRQVRSTACALGVPAHSWGITATGGCRSATRGCCTPPRRWR